jgi:urease accessory protein
VYRSAVHTSVIEQRFRVSAGGTLEWLPQGTLLFGGSRLRQRSVIELASESAFCAWEITSLGRPHSGDAYASGQFEQSVDIFIDAEPVLIERQTWRAGDPLLSAPWGLHGHIALGSLYAYPADADTLARARNATVRSNIGATVLDGVLVVRALADDAVSLQHALTEIWSSIRPLVIGRRPSPPRIWAT